MRKAPTIWQKLATERNWKIAQLRSGIGALRYLSFSRGLAETTRKKVGYQLTAIEEVLLQQINKDWKRKKQQERVKIQASQRGSNCK